MCLFFVAIVHAGKPYQDQVGLKFWRFEMQEIKDDPDAVDIVPYSRIGVYKRLFYKKNGEVRFAKKYDLVRTIDKGAFHQGNFWEAYFKAKYSGKGKYHLPGFEKLKDGCDILVYLRYTKWNSETPYHGKDQVCIIDNRFSTPEEGARRQWMKSGIQLAKKVWRKNAFDLPEGISELVVKVNLDGTVDRCAVEFEGEEQKVVGLERLCHDVLEGADGYEFQFTLALEPSTWRH